jgi:tetratricopeptide (TPR) repeat protein
LVWADGDAAGLDEAWLRRRWPQAKRIEEIGKNLFLVAGIEAPTQDNVASLARVDGCPRQQAEELLAAARRQGNRRAEAAALTDLGLIELNQKQGTRGVVLLEEALGVARLLGDRALQGDILVGLGQASLLAEQAQRASMQLQQAVAIAREAGDRFLEKLALERLGHAYRRLGDGARSLAAFHEALAVARAVGHRLHEAAVLWFLGIVHAELGERDAAIANAQAAIDVFEQAGNSQAPWYAEHLRKYRAGETGRELGDRSEAAADETMFGAVLVGATVWTPPAGSSHNSRLPAQDPGLLRMAVSATQAMMKFLGSGLKTVSSAARERRLRTCAACPHHTGLRCRLCGCFTNVKARLPYEECPLGKW